MWWKKTFRKQGNFGKAILCCSTLFVILCSCSIPIAILSPNTPAPATVEGTSVPLISQIEKATATLSPTNGIESTATFSFTTSIDSSLASSIVPSFESTEILPSPQPLQNPLRVRFIDVGQGDATLIQTPHGQTVLIDGGDTDTGIVQYLQSIGVQRIDLMIATHVHADHIGGLVQVLQAFPVMKVVTNGELYTTSVYEHFLDAIMAAKADFVIIKRGNVLSLDGIYFLCLSPVATTNPDPNENSLVLQFTYGQTTFLMMGDSGADTEADLLASNLLSKVNILKVGHHGSTTGSTPAFLNIVKPDVAVYFAGINNIYGLPDPQTISALVAAHAMVYGTDQNGTIIITVSLDGYTITTAKSATTVSIPTGQPTLAYTPTQTIFFTLTRTPTIPVSSGLVIYPVSPVSRNQNATLAAQTSANASCSITVYTKSGTSGAQGLGSKTAETTGKVSWTWRIGPNTTLGTWSISVTCNNVTQTTTYTVR
jgi:competence protein ComEC